MSPEEFFAEVFASAEGKPTRHEQCDAWGVAGVAQGLRHEAAGAHRFGAAGSGPLHVELDADASGRVTGKREWLGRDAQEYEYSYDDAGRLVAVRRNGVLVEAYAYDHLGRRVASRTEAQGMRRETLEYRGVQLERCGGARFYYRDGLLHGRRDAAGSTYFLYAGPPERCGLERLRLPGGRYVSWRRRQAGLPLEAWDEDGPLERWAWRDLARLGEWEDVRRGMRMRFRYRGGERLPAVVEVYERGYAEPYLLYPGYDQVGTVKALADAEGFLVKTILYDSFGNVVQDSSPYLHYPLGFGGGAVCRWSGFVRFGFRDYDPRTGRFTAPDPLGDTGGDHDLYEYCVDDPIGSCDPNGLEPDGAEGLKKVAKGLSLWDSIKKIGSGWGLWGEMSDEAKDDATVEGEWNSATNSTNQDAWKELDGFSEKISKHVLGHGRKALEKGQDVVY